MTSGLPDFQKAIHLMGAFGRTDYMYSYEVAPWAYDETTDRLKVDVENIIEVSNDVIDRADRLLGVVYGSQGQKILQRATTYDLLVQLRHSGAEIDPRSIRALTSTDVVTVNNPITGFATSALQGGGLPSVLDSDALKVKEQSPISGFATSALQGGGLPSALVSDSLKVTEQSPISGFATSALQGGGLPSALVSDKLKVRASEIETLMGEVQETPTMYTMLSRLKNQSTYLYSIDTVKLGEVQATPTAYTVLSRLKDIDDALSGGLPSALVSDSLKVTEQSPLTGFATSTLQGGGLPSALASDALKVREQTNLIKNPSTLLAGDKDVTAAATPEALASSTTVVNSVLIQAKSTNTSLVYIGNSSTQNVELSAGENTVVVIDDLASIYVKVAVNGEGVNYIGG